MQTFLSEPTFAESASVLDNKRLNKQLLEGRQILAALAGETKGWVNHPATNMWRGYEPALVSYLTHVAGELGERDIAWANNYSAICNIAARKGWLTIDTAGNGVHDVEMPPWWVDDVDNREKNLIMFSHKANLYIKDPEHYAQYSAVAGRFAEALAFDPLAVVCCATRRQGKPCGYYWPTHKEQ